MSNNLPTSTPGESINIAPEYLEIANAYLQSQDVVKVASDLGLEVDFVSAALARREVRAYVNTVFFDVGFNNRGRMRSAMDAILRKKFQEMEEADIGSSKDIAELMALSHKMTMDQLEMELKIENAKKENQLKSQVNVQINETGGGNYNALIERLIEANK